MLRGGSCLAGVLLELVLWAPLARAQAQPVRLEYSRGAGTEHCPDAASVRTSVISRLGYDPFRDDAPRTVSAAISRDKKRLRADVDLRDGSGAVTGTRRLTSDKNDCAELAGAMTLAISIAIDPQSQARPAPPVPVPVPGSASEPVPVPVPGSASAPIPVPVPGPGSAPATAPAARPPTRTASARTPPSAAPASSAEAPPTGSAAADTRSPDASAKGEGLYPVFGAGGVIGLGNAPGVAFGLTAHAGAAWRWLSLTVEGRADLPSYEDASGGGKVSAALIAGSLVPCVHLLPAIFGCAVGTLGSLRGEGEGVPDPRTDSSLYASAGLRGGAFIPLEPPVGLRVTLEGGAVLTPTALELNGSEVWSSPPVYGALGAAAEVRWK